MGRRRLFVASAATGAVLLGLLLVRGARLPAPAVVAALEDALGESLAIEQVRVRPVPQPTLELEGVRVPGGVVVAGCATGIEAERVRVRLALAPLLIGRVVVDRIDVDAPLVRILRSAAVPVPAAPVPGRGGAPPSRSGRETRGATRPIAESERDGRVALRLRRVRVHRGRVQFRDETRDVRWALGRLDLDLGFLHGSSIAGAPVTVDATGLLRDGGREPVAALAMAGTLRWAGRDSRLRGVLESGAFRYGPLRFEGGRGRLAVDGRGAHLRGLELELGDGAVVGRARLLLGEAPSVAVRLAGHGEALGEAFGERDVVVDGRWDARVAVEGPAPWRAEARKGIAGSGRVVVRDGAIEPFEIGSALLDVLAPLRGREQSQRLRDRYPGLFGGDRVRFRRLAGSLVLAGRQVRTRDLTLAGDGYRTRGRGSVSVNGRLALGIEVTLSPGLTEDLLGRGGLAAALGAVPGGGITVPLELEGTIGQPRVRASAEWSRAILRRTLGPRGAGGALERLLR